MATFSYKFTDRQTGKQRTGWLGVYNPETFTVEDAHSKAYGLKGLGAKALAESFRDQKANKAKRGKTVAEIIEERIDWMKTPVKKPDGEMRPRLEASENTASHLRRFLGARLGKTLARDVTKLTSQHSRMTLSRGSSASPPSATPAICARQPRGCSTGRLKRAATM
ncbi:hypothetical protein [Bradyrhizobium sp. WSM471]|uniref:hypothetical protein n=1 Tax=Bradyrhizobium sp. WSM471 TaxID=319017 RepID=UPI00024D2B22|nr:MULTISPECIES: hypothetical protein [Bradyrhizobium]EHR04910.1 hypothetical protein Bra471DRAFT_05715 [Bradyrhizobium sp. WSM471]UFW40043.1 hypothetical protein BcanWSM471_28050 [Bradyrhizobium canariense]